MQSVLRSLALAFASLLHPRMLWLMLWPVLVAAAIWGTVAIVFWAQGALWLAGVLKGWITNVTFFLTWDASNAALIAAKIVIVLLLVPLIQLTALLILGIFGMPAMVEHVAGRYFAALARKRGGSFAGSLLNGLISLIGLVLLGLVTLPLWIFPPLWPLIPIGVLGWVNQRVLRYDALAEHADPQEMKTIFRSRSGTLYVLGVVLALVAYVPVIGFFAPVLFALCVIHYLLAELERLRAVVPAP